MQLYYNIDSIFLWMLFCACLFPTMTVNPSKAKPSYSVMINKLVIFIPDFFLKDCTLIPNVSPVFHLSTPGPASGHLSYFCASSTCTWCTSLSSCLACPLCLQSSQYQNRQISHFSFGLFTLFKKLIYMRWGFLYILDINPLMICTANIFFF